MHPPADVYKRQAAKEGIRGLSRVAATEWGKDGINVNVICPLAWTAKLEQFKQAYPDAVSYTHLDVYKRQVLKWMLKPCAKASALPSVM